MQLEMPGGECGASQARKKPHRGSQVTVSSGKCGGATRVVQKQLINTAYLPAETTQGLYLANGTLETALGFCVVMARAQDEEMTSQSRDNPATRCREMTAAKFGWPTGIPAPRADDESPVSWKYHYHR